MESQSGEPVLPILEAFFRHERERPDSLYLVQPLAAGAQNRVGAFRADAGDAQKLLAFSRH